MNKIKKLLKLFLIIVLSTSSFSFGINELKFEKIIKQNEKETKTFVLINNNVETRLYRLSIEGDKNISIVPNMLNLKAHESKEFKIEVTANKEKGTHDYFLIIADIDKKKIGKGVKLNKTVRIKQSYTIK